MISIQEAPRPTSRQQVGRPTRGILLSSVFGPYARDDEWGSRALNPMELYHNQVTRTQGAFSLRMFHRSWGLMLIQANVSAPCAVLDFPNLERFTEEVASGRYDVIGISSIVSNWPKVRKMCAIIRQHAPHATIVVGGHVANVPDLRDRIDADHIVRGEGVRWFREFLGESTDRPIRHPLIKSGLEARCMGWKLADRPGDVAATIIPSVGCPLGCNFCSTSAMFGGKGRFIDFYPTGDELFDVMRQIEQAMQVRSFFMMDENFLLHRKRAMRLLELMEAHDRAWSLYVFSSANVLNSYSLDDLVRLGVSWVWMGLEGEDCQYAKLRGIDTRALVKSLQSHGIRVLGSSIIGLEEHTLHNISRAIDYAVSHDTDFHQFMLYTPIPGTPLYASLEAAGRIKPEAEIHPGDVHGQAHFNYRHPHLPEGVEGELVLRAFQRDFEINGPSVARIARTTLCGWLRYRDHQDRRVRERYRWEARELATTYAAAVSAARRHLRDHHGVARRLDQLLAELHAAFGWRSRLASSLGGRWLRCLLAKEESRLAQGHAYEPPTIFEINEAMAAQGDFAPDEALTMCCSVAPAG